jgi:hypothetical protein
MRRTILPLLCFSLGSAYAQSLNATGLISAFQAAGLTSLADAAQKANGTAAGQQLLAALVNGTQNYTVFAPNNDACKPLTMHLPVFRMRTSSDGAFIDACPSCWYFSRRSLFSFICGFLRLRGRLQHES